jgi:hypothetical protein
MSKILSTAALAFCALTGTASADMYLVQKHHTDPYSIMGASVPAKDEKSITWSSGDKVSINSDKDTSTILRLDKKMIYIIYRNNKKYSEINLDEMQKQIDQAKGEADNAAAASGVPGGIASMMKFSATVTPTAESKTIGKWNSTKYSVATTMPMGSATTVMWSSTDIKIDYANLAKMKNFAMSSMPGFADMMKEYQKIKGFPVLSETTTRMMGMEVKSKEELVEVSEKAAPAGIYDIPAGFKKKDLK